jgi:hypothetical protein
MQNSIFLLVYLPQGDSRAFAKDLACTLGKTDYAICAVASFMLDFCFGYLTV